jgi:phosphopantetheine adenylyltransferase
MPHLFISASLVKEVARLGAPIDTFVAPPVAQALRAKFAPEG